MIRFVDIDNQVSLDQKQFAWFNTVVSQFLSWDQVSIFDSWEDFIEWTKDDEIDIERFRCLYDGSGGWQPGKGKEI